VSSRKTLKPKRGRGVASRSAVPPRPAPSPIGILPAPIVVALLLGAALILQGSALRAPFFADDYLFLDQVRLRTLTAALTSPDPIGNFFRPFGRQFHFWWLSKLSGESPLAFHAVNLVLLLGAIVLLVAIVRRIADMRSATVAGAFVALHYAADVPVRWASGSQDLLAVTGALGAIWLSQIGRRGWAAVALGLALLSKETVILTPVVAMLIARRPGEAWRSSALRVAPLAAVSAAWVLVWAVKVRPHAAAAGVHLGPGGLVAALVHLVQVTLGAEWRFSAPDRILHIAPPILALLFAGAAVATVGAGFARGSGRAEAAQGRIALRRSALVGAAWALLGALPVAAVAPIWSAYYYFFALCGVGLLIGAVTAGWRRPAVLALLVLLAWGSQNGRRLDEFATRQDAWSTQSHVNRFYLDRAMGRVTYYLDQLKAVHPQLAPRTTVYFAGLPAFVAFQVADGPLLRWAYRDTSLRGYYVTNFTRRSVERGPVYVIQVDGDSLRDITQEPTLFLSMAASAALSEHMDRAVDAIEEALARHPENPTVGYWAGIIHLANGDTAEVSRWLSETRRPNTRGMSPDVPRAAALAAAGDTLQAEQMMKDAIDRRPLDASAHGLLADLMLRNPANGYSTMEALAARALAPERPGAWRRWAIVQAQQERYIEGYASIHRYFSLAGAAADADTAAWRMERELARRQPGGEMVQSNLRKAVMPRR